MKKKSAQKRNSDGFYYNNYPCGLPLTAGIFYIPV